MVATSLICDDESVVSRFNVWGFEDELVVLSLWPMARYDEFRRGSAVYRVRPGRLIAVQLARRYSEERYRLAWSRMSEGPDIDYITHHKMEISSGPLQLQSTAKDLHIEQATHLQ